MAKNTISEFSAINNFCPYAHILTRYSNSGRGDHETCHLQHYPSTSNLLNLIDEKIERLEKLFVKTYFDSLYIYDMPTRPKAAASTKMGPKLHCF